jgi:holliday junction DNA helicase RuvA
MIAKLSGIIDTLKPTEMILDVSGVGYLVNIPLTVYEKLQSEKQAVLFIYTLHKEDQFKLFGFINETEKEIFTLLLNISGIGPSIAMSILSSISISMLVDSVKNQNTGYLVKIPGIGKSKAEKLVFELKNKIKKLETYSQTPGTISYSNEAVEALVSLGFDEFKALKAVEEILKQDPDAPVESIIKSSLGKLSN